MKRVENVRAGLELLVDQRERFYLRYGGDLTVASRMEGPVRLFSDAGRLAVTHVYADGREVVDGWESVAYPTLARILRHVPLKLEPASEGARQVLLAMREVLQRLE